MEVKHTFTIVFKPPPPAIQLNIPVTFCVNCFAVRALEIDIKLNYRLPSGAVIQSPF